MLDLKFILKNVKLIEKNCSQRGVRVDITLIEKMLNQHFQLLREIEEIRSEINNVSGQIKQKGLKDAELIQRGQILKKKLKEKEEIFRGTETTLKEELYKIPNLTHPDAPVGLTEDYNREIRKVGKARVFNFKPKDHLELGKSLDIIDFDGGTQTTGNKFYFLKNEGVLLELALVRYALEIVVKAGFEPYITPDLAKTEIIDAIGYNPRGPETQIYAIEKQNMGLIATAEITLGGLFRDKVLNEKELPLKISGLSHCFRTEAGAYGKTSKGLYRVHQFTKLEMFIFSLPEESDRMLDHLVEIETKIFQGLDIPFRIVDCCTGDLGGPAYRKFDLEAWMPADARWGEITSASNCTDYQARRLGTRFRRENKNEFIHTLNGTGIAVSRALIALLENFQEIDGSVNVPKVLQGWVGKKKILPKK